MKLSKKNIINLLLKSWNSQIKSSKLIIMAAKKFVKKNNKFHMLSYVSMGCCGTWAREPSWPQQGTRPTDLAHVLIP